MSAVAYAWMALWTMRFARTLAVVAAIVSPVCAVVLSFAFDALPGPEMRPDGVLVTLLRTNIVAPIATLVLAVAVAGADVGRGIVLAPLLRAGGRQRAWFVRLATAGLIGVLVGTLCVGSTAAVVSVIVGPLSVGVVAKAGAGVVALCLGWACIGVGAGSAIRHQLRAVAMPVVIAYIAEPAVRTIIELGPIGLQPLARLLPFAAGADLVRGDWMITQQVLGATASLWSSVFAFACLALGTALAGMLVFRRCDLVPTDPA